MTALFVSLLGVHALALAVRIFLAFRWFAARSERGPQGDESEVTIVQPILSGDPHLEDCLRRNLEAMPRAGFLWLVDSDDAQGIAICRRLAPLHGRLAIVEGPPPANGENPKLAKLERGLASVQTRFLAVLDDDTILPPGMLALVVAALDRADLATALPAYVAEGGPWSRLVAAFVNGNAMITYPVGAALGQQRTINVMFYCARTDDFRALGGFSAILGELTDDYAVARLFLDSGRRIVQTPFVHPIRTHIRDGAHYVSLMRRWMIFGMRYMRENPSLFTIGLIGVSTVLPPVLLLLAFAVGSWAVAAVLALLAAKAAALAGLRHWRTGRSGGVSAMGFEMAADMLTPFHVLAGAIRSDRLQWRSRRIALEQGEIRYE